MKPTEGQFGLRIEHPILATFWVLGFASNYQSLILEYLVAPKILSLSEQFHGTAIDLSGIAVLLRGSPRPGKSDLALRLIDQGGQLISDVRVDMTYIYREIYLSSLVKICGFLEVYGMGLLKVGSNRTAPVRLVIDLARKK